MHDTYEAGVILERLPLKIECIASYGKIIVNGNRKWVGHMFTFDRFFS